MNLKNHDAGEIFAEALALSHPPDRLAYLDRACGGDLAGAESSFRESLAMWRKLFGDRSPHVANSLGGLAEALQVQGRWAEAEVLHREALSIWEHGEPDDWRGFNTRTHDSEPRTGKMPDPSHGPPRPALCGLGPAGKGGSVAEETRCLQPGITRRACRCEATLNI